MRAAFLLIVAGGCLPAAQMALPAELADAKSYLVATVADGAEVQLFAYRADQPLALAHRPERTLYLMAFAVDLAQLGFTPGEVTQGQGDCARSLPEPMRTYLADEASWSEVDGLPPTLTSIGLPDVDVEACIAGGGCFDGDLCGSSCPAPPEIMPPAPPRTILFPAACASGTACVSGRYAPRHACGMTDAHLLGAPGCAALPRIDLGRIGPPLAAGSPLTDGLTAALDVGAFTAAGTLADVSLHGASPDETSIADLRLSGTSSVSGLAVQTLTVEGGEVHLGRLIVDQLNVTGGRVVIERSIVEAITINNAEVEILGSHLRGPTSVTTSTLTVRGTAVSDGKLDADRASTRLVDCLIEGTIPIAVEVDGGAFTAEDVVFRGTGTGLVLAHGSLTAERIVLHQHGHGVIAMAPAHLALKDLGIFDITGYGVEIKESPPVTIDGVLARDVMDRVISVSDGSEVQIEDMDVMSAGVGVTFSEGFGSVHRFDGDAITVAVEHRRCIGAVLFEDIRSVGHRTTKALKSNVTETNCSTTMRRIDVSEGELGLELRGSITIDDLRMANMRTGVILMAQTEEDVSLLQTFTMEGNDLAIFDPDGQLQLLEGHFVDNGTVFARPRCAPNVPEVALDGLIFDGNGRVFSPPEK